MKILHVLGSNSFSGAENVACQIINMTRDFAESVYVSKNGLIKDALESREIRHIMLDKLSILKLKQVLKAEKPDVVHAHDMKASFICSIAIDKKTRFISHIHNNNYNSRRLTLKSVLYAFAAKKSDHIIWVSKSSYEGYIYSKFFKNKSTILYNVIDTASIIENIEKDDKNYYYDIIFVGRLAYPKNPHKFVEIIAKLREQYPNVTAAMVGSGEYYNEISSLIKKNGLEKNISLLGFLDNPYKIMSNCKIMIITSEWEGTPMCALEAMFLGIPIISTPVDGMKDLIKENLNGFFASDTDSFVEYIKLLLSDKHLYNEVSKCQKDVFQTVNSLQKYADKIKDLYSEHNGRSIAQQ